MEIAKTVRELIRTPSLALLGCLLVGLSVVQPVATAYAADLAVDSLLDNATGGDGYCTLREAINNANSNSDTTSGDCVAGDGDDSISVSVSGTIVLGSALPEIAASGGELTISGPGPDSLSISGDSRYRVLEIQSGATVSVSGVTIRDGAVTDTVGAGILNDGSLTLTDSIVADNTAVGIASQGGGIYNDTGTLMLADTRVSGNSAGVTGGGIYNNGGAIIAADCSVSGNAVTAGRGGGISNNGGSLVVRNCTISHNRSEDHGGGLWNLNGAASLTDCTISGNESMLSGAWGGGAYNRSSGTNTSTLVLTNTTISGNTARGGAGGLVSYAPEGTAVVTMTNSLIADNSTSGISPDCWANASFPIVSQGFNLIEDISNCNITGITAGNITGQDPTLDALRNNGGDADTQALRPGSPAIDQIPVGTNGCGTVSTTDQRGEGRSVDYDRDGWIFCDIGAFELQADEMYSSSLELNEPFTFGATLVTMTLNSGDPGIVTVIKYNQPPGGGLPDSNEMPTYWTVDATGTSFDIDLALCYTDWEQGSLTESAIRAYRWDGSDWVQQSGSGPVANCVTVGNVTELSSWALGTGSPTAVSLLNATARPRETSMVLLLLGILALGVIGLALSQRWPGRSSTQ